MRVWLICGLLMGGAVSLVWAGGAVSGPVEMTGDTLEWRQKDQEATLSGHVVVTRRDMTLKADILTATYGETKGQVDKLVAKGHVTITRGGAESATGDVAVFEVSANRLTLTGQAVTLNRGPSSLAGDKLVYDLATGNAKVTRSGGPVKARFTPSQDQ